MKNSILIILAVFCLLACEKDTEPDVYVESSSMKATATGFAGGFHLFTKDLKYSVSSKMTEAGDQLFYGLTLNESDYDPENKYEILSLNLNYEVDSNYDYRLGIPLTVGDTFEYDMCFVNGDPCFWRDDSLLQHGHLVNISMPYDYEYRPVDSTIMIQVKKKSQPILEQHNNKDYWYQDIDIAAFTDVTSVRGNVKFLYWDFKFRVRLVADRIKA